MDTDSRYQQFVAWLRSRPDRAIIVWWVDESIVRYRNGEAARIGPGTVYVENARVDGIPHDLWALTETPGPYDLLVRPFTPPDGPIWAPELVDKAIIEWCGTHANRRVTPLWDDLGSYLDC